MEMPVWPQAFRRRVLHCAVVGAAVVVMVSARISARTTDLGVTDRVVIASRIYAMVQQYFAHCEGARRPQVEAAYREYIERAVGAADRKAFDLATMRFIARLRNGHSQFFDSRMDARPLKFRLLEVENVWAVVNSQDNRLPQGAVVKTLEGRPVDDFIQERAEYVAASNERLARTHVFSYPGLFPERVSVGLQNGDVVVVDRAVRGDAPELSTVRMSEGRWLIDGRVAYIRVPAFGDPAYEQSAIDLVRKF